MKKSYVLLFAVALGWVASITGCKEDTYDSPPRLKNQDISILLKNLPTDAIGKKAWLFAFDASGKILYTTVTRAAVDTILTFAAPSVPKYGVGIFIAFNDNWEFSEEFSDGYLMKTGLKEGKTLFLKVDSYGVAGDEGVISPIVTCNLLNPDDEDVYYPGEIINIVVNASYDQGFITEVVLKVDGQVYETSTFREPGDNYKFQWNTTGKTGLKYYTFEAIAKNNLGQTSSSKAKVWLSQDEVFGPSCDITDIYEIAGDSMVVEAFAQANNVGDNIISVDFYLDGSKKVSDSQGNFGFFEGRMSIKNLSVGIHEVKAVATDSKNRTKYSIENIQIDGNK